MILPPPNRQAWPKVHLLPPSYRSLLERSPTCAAQEGHWSARRHVWAPRELASFRSHSQIVTWWSTPLCCWCHRQDWQPNHRSLSSQPWYVRLRTVWLAGGRPSASFRAESCRLLSCSIDTCCAGVDLDWNKIAADIKCMFEGGFTADSVVSWLVSLKQLLWRTLKTFDLTKSGLNKQNRFCIRLEKKSWPNFNKNNNKLYTCS